MYFYYKYNWDLDNGIGEYQLVEYYGLVRVAVRVVGYGFLLVKVEVEDKLGEKRNICVRVEWRWEVFIYLIVRY